MKVRVYVSLKPAVLDPQGKAICNSLHRLGYEEVESTRLGKYIELELNETDPKIAAKRVDEMCRTLLSNPLIENARHEFAE